MRIDRSIDDKLLKVVGAIIIVPYVIVMTLVTIAITLGPLMIAAMLTAIGCLSLVIQWMKNRAILLRLLFKWYINRWWWFKKKNF